MFLKPTYFAPPDGALMRNVGAVADARSRFLNDRFPNLDHLLRSRYEWMNSYLEGMEEVVELGGGSGLSKLYLTNPRVKVSDCAPADWLDLTVDALNMPFEDQSVDALICSHMVHHLAYPRRLFIEATRVLKPGGLILIQDIHCSLLMRVLMRVMRVEGWSYEIDVFSDTKPVNDPRDPWSGNNAVPDLMFADGARFSGHFPELSIERRELCECLAMVASGGVTAKTAMPHFPIPLLNLLQTLDRAIAAGIPDIAALGQRVVIRRR